MPDHQGGEKFVIEIRALAFQRSAACSSLARLEVAAAGLRFSLYPDQRNDTAADAATRREECQ